MKVEVKWPLRVPIWPAEQALFRTVFPGEPSQVTVLSREEVVAGKVAALLDRAAPRDLFDMAELARHGAMGDPDRLRAATILLGSFHVDDFRARLARKHLEGIAEGVICSQLWPTLRRDLRPSFEELRRGSRTGPGGDPVADEARGALPGDVLREASIRSRDLFDGLEADPNLAQHPMAAWRLRRRPEGED